MSRRIVAVMGSDLSAADDQRAAEALGEALASHGWVVLTGGRLGARGTSVMHLVLGGAKRVANSVTVGVLPYEQDNEQTSPHADVRIFTGMNNARNAINVLSGDVVIAFGRITPGTASEIALALKSEKPVLLYRADEKAAALFTSIGVSPARLASSIDEIVAEVQRHIPAGPPWES
jgi:uncharacterized protein (TIGR00725 family)